ncbi:hypothetical protein VTI74DRAFT_5215 [Chaetomium olivicolor]
MWSFKNTCAILGLCLVALSNVAAAGSISMQEAYRALPHCAQRCFQTAIGQSTCLLTDVTCICNDQKLNNVTTACITSMCTVKESLTAKNLTSQVCGLTDRRDDSLIPFYAVFNALAVVAVILRLAARAVTQAYFWWDDLSNFVGFLCSALFTAISIKSVQLGQSKDIWFLPFDIITQVLKIFFFQMVFYALTRLFVRASIILFYMRIFPPQSGYKLGRVVQCTFVFNMVYNFSFLMAVVFQCSPVSEFWHQWEGLYEGHCGNANILVWVAATTGIVFDLWLLALPLSQLLTMNLYWKKKVMGGLMFFFGVAVMIISLVRLKTINEATRTVNPTKDIAQLCLWSGIELDVGVICPCLPSFRLLLRRLLPRVVGTSRRYELDTVPNATEATCSGMRKGFAGVGASGGGGRIIVENSIAAKYGRSDETDERSCRSVTSLVEEQELSARDEESGQEHPGARSR